MLAIFTALVLHRFKSIQCGMLQLFRAQGNGSVTPKKKEELSVCNFALTVAHLYSQLRNKLLLSCMLQYLEVKYAHFKKE